jgi:hypothetical protein
MHRTPEQLLDVIRKTGIIFLRTVITAQEFINKVFDEFALTECVYPDLVPELWQVIPAEVRDDFAIAVRNAARPDFRYIAFYIGSEQSMSEDELRRAADLPTQRVQAWAREFVRYLDSLKT